MFVPLADRLRPKELEDVVGQTHLLSKGKVLRNIIESGTIPNMIFYGPSGVGKTTVARIIADKTDMRLHKLNGTSASTADIKSVVEEIDTLVAQKGILLYLDEIQYLNKKQQQSLLEYIEKGDIILIASTAENPYFYVYNAILSRSTVFEFKPVEKQQVKKAVKRAFDFLREERNENIDVSDEVLEHISLMCGGDVRKAINAVELCVISAPMIDNVRTVTMDQARLLSQKSSFRYDRDGDEHFDILSAFQKSIRGSDENAALHYLARLVVAGDLPSICRRLLVIAAEDIGLAYPMGIVVTKACVDAAMQLGFPEAQIPLAQAVILLATAPKSNSAVCAVNEAVSDIKSGKIGEIPAYIRDSHYSGAEKLGRGLTYKYPHDFPGNWVSQQYLPNELKDVKYYKYGNNKNEQAFKAYWEMIKKEKNS